MHCFDVQGTEIREGIPVFERVSSQTGDEFLAVEVGEEGRGRTLHWVGLARGVKISYEEPPRIYRVGVVMTKKHRHLIVKDDGSDKALVRLYFTEGFRGSNNYEYLKGASEITWGYRAQGLAGRMGGGYEVLIVMDPGAVVKCTRKGELRDGPSEAYLTWDGSRLEFQEGETL